MSQGGAHGRYTGQALAGGRYQLRDVLGEGGMASVHLAYDAVLDRQVAIKTLHTELGREHAFRERFRREAQAVAKLTHTNIVSVFDTGEDELNGTATPYIVMEYVEGRPLGSVLEEDVRQFGAMSVDKALKTAADVLAALEISHETGLVHRDIKPGNVMVTKRGVVKVMDFGIARAMQSGVSSMTQTGMVVGTPQYLSPEQALGRAVDARSDLYSVGIMLFQLITGRLPFDADSPLAIAYAHVQEEPVAPSTINRVLPPAVDALVARALKKNPNERFPTAASMREECLRVAASVQATPPNIVPGAGPVQSGAGVGSAVFPPVGPAAPGPSSPAMPGPSGPVQMPYQPTPYAPQAPAPAYGYPQHSGYQTPPVGYGPQPTPAPPPYGVPLQPGGQPSGNDGKGNKLVIIGSVTVSLIVAVGLAVALALNNKDGGGTAGGGGASASASTSHKAGYRGPDTSRRIDKTECTDPRQSYDDPTKIRLPDFRYKNIDSVKQCFQAAGWAWKIKPEDNNTWGDGTVLDQFPAQDTDVDPKNIQTVELGVSTGNPPQ
ncbi:serine/threonine protein kinase [Streptomyces pluripotens]|uniref:non-specific serine/threonine protein kinase n=1 Tax=Streptomyces pluripotens TaxID=1355015 RepID=A0A221NZP2_9ACTN|nr:Stk1 family PASTA domain-containing Ser/Thr kinase [Streptomyces pluripotens]ARP71114.1 serine/threonine protein kinase [Streptomyces pluripotens]ASN25362.1 serine/threonine protein kinase [Streptomyces pluripotens]